DVGRDPRLGLGRGPIDPPRVRSPEDAGPEPALDRRVGDAATDERLRRHRRRPDCAAPGGRLRTPGLRLGRFGSSRTGASRPWGARPGNEPFMRISRGVGKSPPPVRVMTSMTAPERRPWRSSMTELTLPVHSSLIFAQAAAATGVIAISIV